MTDEELSKIEDTNKEKDDFVFMREEIKSRPINRKHLARNTLAAAISAVVFGLVACVTFALLSPFILERISNESEPEVAPPAIITFPEETEEEEMQPEEMLTNDMLAPEATEVAFSEFAALEEEQIKELLSTVTFSLGDYQNLYKSMAEIADTAKKSLVRVTPVKSGTDWFDNLYETPSELSGLIVAKSDEEIFIATRYSAIKGNEDIIVTFVNGIRAVAEIIGTDSTMDICVLSVKTGDVNELTKETITVASYTSSNSLNLVGAPCIAVGSPMGTYDSVNYGMVTANTAKINVTDNTYKQVVTNIYGSQSASGVVVNLRGEVIAFIDVKNSSSDTKNLICGVGISELKRTIERLVNREELVMFGITGADVPSQAVSEGTPLGVFVMSVKIDSPAMKAGIQSGDIIYSLGDIQVTRFAEFLNVLYDQSCGTTVPVTVCRNVQGKYKEVALEITFDTKSE